jgi:polyphosphate kinase
VAGLSENINVRSVIGRFLEHHRIYYFYADGADQVYLSSADWMERNFFRRIEIGFPILSPSLKRRVLKEGLRAYLADNAQSWLMDSEGNYKIKTARRQRVCGQELLLAELRQKD